MSREIEADYKEDYQNEEKCCPYCDSHQAGYCPELEQTVSNTGHCDFFRAKD